MSLHNLFVKLKGGPTSGNFGHAGRPGKRGGSVTSSLSNVGLTAGIQEILNGSRVTENVEEAREVLGYLNGLKQGWEKELDERRKQPTSSENNIAIKNLREKIRDVDQTASNALNVKDPSKLKPNLDEFMRQGPNIKNQTQKGVDDFNRLVSNRLIPKDPENAPKFGYVSQQTRDYYDKDKGTVFTSGSNSHVTTHELGHWLEYNSKGTSGLQRKSFKHWKERTKGERYKSLSEVTKNSYYDSREKTRVDSFADPYMGKHYSNKSTEIVSMGLEYMVKDPIGFADKDPQSFEFVYNAVRGKY